MFCPTSPDPFAKIFLFLKIGKCGLLRPSRAHRRGGSRSSRNVARDAMDAPVAQGECTEAYGQAVWSCPPDAGVKLVDDFHERRWLKSPGHRGEHGAADKTIVQGMPGCCGVPVVTTLVCFFVLQTRLWVRRAPGIPCALRLDPRDIGSASPGRFTPRECWVVSSRGPSFETHADACSSG